LPRITDSGCGTGFNPPLARWPGETRARWEYQLPRLVFQSAPGTLARGNCATCWRSVSRRCFNPPLARWPGETRPPRTGPVGRSSFNPPLARWPGETWVPAVPQPSAAVFQSAPGTLARGNGLPELLPQARARFNPPLARWPGETVLLLPLHAA